MEELKVEQLEEVEVEEVKPENEVKVLEYEKLLMTERNRADFQKAKNLIKYGCFEQKQEKEIDFEKFEQIKTEKKYRGLYTLYRSLENMQLVFVAPLVENNKGDVDENLNMKPYGYDVIYLDPVDEETYQMVKKAYVRNNITLLGVLYKASFITFIALVVLGLFVFGFIFANYVNTDFLYAVSNGLQGSGIYFAGALVALPLLVLMSIKYKKYKGE